MSAQFSRTFATGRVLIVAALVISACACCTAQQSLSHPAHQADVQIAALAERLAVQLIATNKKKPFVSDLTLPGDIPSPLGSWLADKISESLAQSHPELEVIPRSLWPSAPSLSEPIHDRNQENAAIARRSRSLGAEVLVTGNFAAIPNGVGITLMAQDQLSSAKSHLEALAELPLSMEMRAVLNSPLPERMVLDGVFKSSMAGIGSPLCEECPPPRYTYVARAKKLTGVVLLQVWVTSSGAAETVKIIRAPNSFLGNAAVRTVRTWRFRPAFNAQGEFVPVTVEVAVSFQLDAPRHADTAALAQ